MRVREFEFRGARYKVACVEDYPDHPTWFTYVDESDVRERFWRIGPGDVVLDVGAAFGSYAVTALAAGASRVWAWAPEGIPGSVSEVGVLRATLELNGWSDRCEVLTNGVYDRDGWLHTKTQEFSEAEPPGHDLHTIPVSTLSAWERAAAPERVDWLKLDVEGAEVRVLQGALALLFRHRPKVLVENHLFVRPTIAEEVGGIMRTLGYSEEATVPYNTVSHTLWVP